MTTHASPRPWHVPALLGWLALCFAVAGIGAVASTNAPQFYGQLVQPRWAPPPTVFGPVWSVLYLLMAVAAWLVGREWPGPGRRRALALFGVQLAANALWSWLFFAWHLGGWAFADIVLLWLLLAATVVHFWRLRPLAGALLLPYLAWVGFALVLNLVLWRANPQLLGG